MKTDVEILMLDGCTRSEAERHLKKGTIIFDGFDFEKHFESYMDEWEIEEDEREQFKNMINNKVPATDWGVVESEGKTLYIMYVL